MTKLSVFLLFAINAKLLERNSLTPAACNKSLSLNTCKENLKSHLHGQ